MSIHQIAAHAEENGWNFKEMFQKKYILGALIFFLIGTLPAAITLLTHYNSI